LIFHITAAINGLRKKIAFQKVRKSLSVLHHTGLPVGMPPHSLRLLFVIAHVVPPAQQDNPVFLERLQACMDALLKSYDGFQKTIILLSKQGYSIASQLPAYMAKNFTVYESKQTDPMLVEFDAWHLMEKYAGTYDYFTFLEDDILMEDTWWFNKMEQFNEAVANTSYLLFPHRYEYSEGTKYYNDQMMMEGHVSERYHFQANLGFGLGTLQFCQYENPHAGMYCLQAAQANNWLAKGNPYQYETTAYGTLESAATFNLMHQFEIFKPHPTCMHFLQVRHWGAKYLAQFEKAPSPKP
jgi:hypothetical protein